MKTSTITGLYKLPGKPAEWRTVKNSIASLQRLVGGYIETFTIFSDCVFICNEEGRLRGMEPNFRFCGQTFVGPVFICGTFAGEFVGLHLSGEAEARILKEIKNGEVSK